ISSAGEGVQSERRHSRIQHTTGQWRVETCDHTESDGIIFKDEEVDKEEKRIS
ncbi:hypothetical protein RUM43_004945, partial [Polyplax serrata]